MRSCEQPTVHINCRSPSPPRRTPLVHVLPAAVLREIEQSKKDVAVEVSEITVARPRREGDTPKEIGGSEDIGLRRVSNKTAERSDAGHVLKELHPQRNPIEPKTTANLFITEPQSRPACESELATNSEFIRSTSQLNRSDTEVIADQVAPETQSNLKPKSPMLFLSLRSPNQ